MSGQHRRAWRGAAIVLALLPLVTPPATRTDGPAALAQEAPGTYRLRETWSERILPAQAGRLGRPLDLASSPDGRYLVLDAEPPALHQFEADDRPRSLRPLPAGVTGLRIDAGGDGALRILGRDASGWRVDRWREATGFQAPQRPEPPPGSDYVDIAGDAAGARTWLLASGTARAGSPRLELRGPDGALLRAAELRERFLPGCARLEARALDQGAEARIVLAIARDESGCPDPNAPGPEPGDPRPPVLDGLIELDVETLEILDLRPMAVADDLSAGPDGLRVVAGRRLLDGDSGAPIAELAEPASIGAETSATTPLLRLDLAPDGIARGVGADCPLPGLLRFDGRAPRGGRRLASLASPPLEGPRLPVALARWGAELALLRGPLAAETRRYAPGSSAPRLQLWSATEGRPIDQLALCAEGNPPPIAAQAVDLAGAEPGLVLAAPRQVEQRPDGLEPVWRHGDPAAHFLAVDAEGRRTALLDAARRELRLLRDDGSLEAAWPLDRAPEAQLPVDLALTGDRIYLADQGRARVEVLGLDGNAVGGFGVHDGPRRIAAGPDGSLFLLGRSGLGLRYARDGRLLASWALPELPGILPLDIAAGPDGQVQVGFVRGTPPGPDRDFGAAALATAGIWVFEPVAGSPGPPQTPPDESCALSPDKQAAPARLPLGAQTTVTLSITGRCPGWQEPQHLAIALDSAAGAAEAQALDRARATLLALLGSLDPDNLWLGLAGSIDGRPSDLPLSHEIDAVRARIAGARAGGTASLAEAVGRARAILAMPPALPGARRSLLVVQAGATLEPGLPRAIEAARADGLDVVIVSFRADGQRPSIAELALLGGQPEDRFVDPSPFDLIALVGRASAWRAEPGLLEQARVTERLPTNMRYVEGSAEPPASYDPASHSLGWSLSAVPARPGLQLRYRLEPQETGTWPIHIAAEAEVLDRYGTQSRRGFPLPRVEVFVPPSPPPARPIYLPFALRQACVPSLAPLDIVLVMDVSSSMAEPDPGGGSKLDAAKDAAATLLELLRLPRDRVGLVAFDADARRARGLDGDRAALGAALAALVVGEGTRIDLGLTEAAALLAEAPRAEARRAVILLTDGLQNGPAEPVYQAAAGIRAGGARIFALGLGADVDAEMLRGIASRPEDYLSSPTAADLAGLYQDILAAIDCDG